jgi:hypothetical protein
MLVRDLAQNLQSPHLIAKNLDIKIKGTLILPVCYGYGTLREEWKGGCSKTRRGGNQFGTKEEEVTGGWGKIA